MPQTGDVDDGTVLAPAHRRARAVSAVLALLALVAATACSGGERPLASPPSSSPVPSAPSPSPSPSSSSAPSPPATLTWADCEDGFSCATLRVALDEDDPGAGSVDLALTRRAAPDPAAKLGSLVVNPGGPGVSAVDYLQAAWETVPEPVRARFDLVAFDPRGVGRSAPVRCGTTAELDKYFALDPSPDDAAELAALERGSERFAAGCARRSGPLLPHVSTADAAADLDRVRAAVGDERLTYLGYSYGTSLGAAYLDRFPTRVRAMVLDGALDPALTWDELVAGQARGFDRALAAFLADCERTRCAFRRQVSGDLLSAYDRLAARVDESPLPAAGTRTVGPGELSLAVGAGLYSPAFGWPALAAALRDAERGDGAALLALSDAYLERQPGGYANTSEANLAVNCLDRPWPRTTAPYVALAERVARDAPRFGSAIVLAGLGCAAWPVPAVGTPHAVSGRGAPPVVVVGTTGDPATPYSWSVALAEQLERGVLVTVRGEGHTVYREGAPTCVRAPLDAYLVTGRVPAATTC